MPTARHTAWNAYQTVARELLPAVEGPRLRGFVARVQQDAPMWGEDGPMLLAALRGVVLLHRCGDHAGVVELLRAVADRLYVVSAGPGPARPGGRGHPDCARNAGVYRPLRRPQPPHPGGPC
jgi:hypothetical protein